MKKLMRLLAAVLALTMLCEMLPLAAFAEASTSNTVSAVTNQENLIPEDALEWKGKHYKFYDSAYLDGVTTWEDASSFCQKMGGHLAVICSQAENDFLFQAMKSMGYSNAYFGYTDSKVEGTWEWVVPGASTYTNWAPGEPNSESSREDYAMFYWKYTNGAWNDGTFVDGTVSGGHVFICEWSTLGNQEQGFTFGRDNLKFLNSDRAFFTYGERLENALSSKLLLIKKTPYTQFQKYYNYNISEEKFKQLIWGLSPAIKKSILETRFSEWGGSCRGMSTVVMLQYLYPEFLPLKDLSSVSAEEIYDLPSPKDNDEIEDLVNYYQLAQYLPTFYLKKLETVTNSMTDFSGTLADLVSSLENGNPVLIGMRSAEGGHAVVFLNIIDQNEDAYRIRIYDPNAAEPQTLVLLKTPYIYKEDGKESTLLGVQYGNYQYINSYVKADEPEIIDIRNYFGLTNNELFSNYDVSLIRISPKTDVTLWWNGAVRYQVKNGEEVKTDEQVVTFFDECEDETGASIRNIAVRNEITGAVKAEITPRSDGSDTNILLGDSLLSISADEPIKLTYDEFARTVDVSADDPTAVSLLMTQNTVNDSWPWHSWAVDTTGTTTLHVELDSEGLHLTGDGLTGAKYATENADTEQTSKGTINVQPDETGKTSVTIINKNDGDTDDTEVKGEDKAEETTYTVTVSGGTASPAKAKEGETVTIAAEKTDAFQNWTVVAGGITLENESLPTTTFTMGKENVIITANYSSGGNITPPSPGEPGQSPSDDGGAGIVLAIGAAATVAAGIGAIALMPVKVEGKVELADHTALPGAKIALLQNGKVVAQTTTDADGKFALKVKRGSYELTAAYTDANGQLMHKTASFKAPAKNLTVTF